MRPTKLLHFVSLPRRATPAITTLVLLAGALLLAWIATRGAAPGSLDSSAGAPRVEAVAGDVTEASALPGAQIPSVRAPAELENAPPTEADRALAETSAGESDDDRVWELVEQLRALAEKPATFHEEALRVIESLTAACGVRLPNDSSPDIVQELMARVVVEPEESALVRGAVLLAVSTLLNDGEFVAHMAALFDLATETHNELLRACALGAALRGEKSYCSSPIDLAYLSGLQTSRDKELPRLYPMRVKTLMDAQAAAIVGTWIDWNAIRLADLVKEDEREGSATQDMVHVGEMFVTSELLFTLWGQRALTDAEKEDRVIMESSRTTSSSDKSDLIYFRAAQFVVHSLALCNDRLFDVAVKLSASDDRLSAAIAKSMQGIVADDLGVALLSKLERLRYSTEPGDVDLLELALLEVGETLSTVDNPQALEKSGVYLRELVLDPGLGELTRSMALKAIVDSGSWSAITKSAKAVFAENSPDMLHAQSLTALVTQAGEDAQRRAEVVLVLTDAKKSITTPWVLAEMNAYIEQLSK